MKKKIILIVLIVDLILIGLSSLVFNDNKDKYISNNIIASVEENIDLSNYHNIYYKKLELKYVNDTSVKTANNKQDLLNIIYTTLNSGYDFYDFKCSRKYTTCANDLLFILNDRNTLNVINNLVNPFNSINLNVKLTYLTNGDIRLLVNKKYSNDQIYYLNNKVDYIIKMLISDNMNDETKIRKVHDYLTNVVTYGYGDNYDNAYGALVNRNAICTGYADAFSIFMDKLNIKNYKVVSNTHVWNVVYVNNEWKHIDVTFDDPANNYDINASNYNYYLINSNKLNNSNEHNFNKEIYSELI